MKSSRWRLAPPAPAEGNRIRGELDAVTLQALRKNPEERYPSVRALIDDVNAWLDHKPVSAHHSPWWRRSLNFVRRHRVQSAAAAAVLISVIAGSGVSLRYARQADRQRALAEARFDQVRRLAHAALFDLHDAIQDLPGSTRARQMLVERALEYLRDLAATGRKEPGLQLEIATAYMRIGEVQGNLGHAHVGNTQGAVDSETTARRLAKEILRSHPALEAAESVLADADERLARLGEWQGDTRTLWELVDEATGIRQREAARHPGDEKYAARALAALAQRRALQKDWVAAAALFEAAVTAYREAIAREPADPSLAPLLRESYGRLGQARKQAGNLTAALECYRQAQRFNQARLAAKPGVVPAQIGLSFDLVEGGWLEHMLGQHQQAIADFKQALAIQERLAAADPDDMWMEVEAAKLLNTMGIAFEQDTRYEPAIDAFKAVGERLAAARLRDPANQDTRLHVGWVWTSMGETYERDAETQPADSRRARADWTNAAASFERAIGSLKGMNFQERSDFDLHPEPLIAAATKGLADCRRRLH